MNRTVKLKGTNLFSKERWGILRKAVSKVNLVTMKASMLAKAYYLSQEEAIPMDKHFYDLCIKVVTNDGLAQRGEMTAEKRTRKELYDSIVALFRRDFGAYVDLEGLSLSQVLGYASQDLETAALNNVQFHYPKYVNLYLYSHLPGFAKSIVAKARDHLLYDSECPGALADWIAARRGEIVPTREKDFGIDVIDRPWVYLRHMVSIIRTVEERFPGRKLLSPIVLRRSYVPKNVRLDTNGIVQLLMNKDDIKEFVDLYSLENEEKPNLKGKASLGSSFEKVFSRKPADEREDFLYQQSFWKFLCRFDHPIYKKAIYGGLVFGNSITTDGCSVSLLLVSKEAKKKKKLRRVKKKKNTDAFETEADEEALFLGCDPGKRDLICVTDGSNSFRYTKGQRDSDCQREKYERRSIEFRSKLMLKGKFQSKKEIVPGYHATIENPSLLQYESEVMSKASSKSCVYENFATYVRSKVFAEDEVSKLYDTPRFRNDKFSKYVLTKSSEDKMLNRLKKFVDGRRGLRIKEPFDEIVSRNFEKTDYDSVNVFYGNWGRSPNLKNQAPTPGIGLRRKIDSVFKTITVSEHYTSKTCPRCKERVLENAKLEGPTRKVACKHSLLSCTNCGSWWNRNVVGAYNILLRGLNVQAGSASA